MSVRHMAFVFIIKGFLSQCSLWSAFAEKSPNSDFLGQTGPKKVRIYTEKSEFYHFPFIQRLFYINELSQQL